MKKLLLRFWLLLRCQRWRQPKNLHNLGEMELPFKVTTRLRSLPTTGRSKAIRNFSLTITARNITSPRRNTKPLLTKRRRNTSRSLAVIARMVPAGERPPRSRSRRGRSSTDGCFMQYDLDVKGKFNKDPQGNLKKADENWPGLVDKYGK